MTDSDDFSATRPISVAELLAKNGTIGAPPVGGRRRRRRGNSDAVTVAELTGEIPIIRPDTLHAEPASAPAETAPEPVAEPEPEPQAVAEPAAPEAPAEHVPAAVENEIPSAADEMAPDDTGAHYVVDEEILHTDIVEPAPADAATDDYEDHLRRRDAEADPVEFVAPARKPAFRWSFKPVRGAEEMSPDLADEDVPADAHIDDDLLALKDAEPVAKLDTGVIPVVDDTAAVEVPESTAGLAEVAPARPTSREDRSARYDALFSGFAADEDTRREELVADHGERDQAVLDEADHDEADHEHAASGSGLKRGAWVVGQSLLAVAFGAGMFFAFDQLWRWNQIVALMLSMLVILGLVAGIRVIRKDHDLASTLIAILVGGLVTFGPLALLYSA
ncbi:FUSC family protein [Mycolicibacterium sp. CBMA 226]|uniref:FUSC family protein n=1 Tax=Mycolicibacterium sp. CBMA 226 TaxID=2606611 RepID=UPI0012DE7B96|nr:FUSC family protein [Mycolicibacterium sp. CBMA 226]MUL76705.1 FUSC family protein [Mycolicibacterium sp. CBMA 226]